MSRILTINKLYYDLTFDKYNSHEIDKRFLWTFLNTFLYRYQNINFFIMKFDDNINNKYNAFKLITK